MCQRSVPSHSETNSRARCVSGEWACAVKTRPTSAIFVMADSASASAILCNTIPEPRTKRSRVTIMVKRGLKVLAMTSTAAFALRSVVFITPPRQQARRIQPPIDGEMARQHWIALVVFRAPVRSAALCRAGPSPNLRCRGTAWQASEFMFSTRELGAIQIASCVHHGTTDKILCND